MNGHAPTTITKEQIQKYKEEKAIECRDVIYRILGEYDCELVAIPQFTEDGRVMAQVAVKSK